MKITKEDYKKLRDKAFKIVKENKLLDNRNIVFSDKDFRWELYHAVNHNDFYRTQRELHKYLSDENIDTALRKIVKELLKDPVPVKCFCGRKPFVNSESNDCGNDYGIGYIHFERVECGNKKCDEYWKGSKRGWFENTSDSIRDWNKYIMGE